MIKMNHKEWESFHLDEIFRNYHGKRLNKEKRVIGRIPMLTASEVNQGVSEYISNDEMKSIQTVFL